MENQDTNQFLPVLTLVLWTGCLAVGVAGLRMAYPRPRPLPAASAPAQATVLQVQVQKETLAPPVNGPAAPSRPEAAPAALPAPAPLPQVAAEETPPPMTALATVNPFVEHVRPAPIMRNAPATRAAVSAPPVQSAPVVQQLTLGQGEGAQPLPEYPREAQIAGQEGVVVVRFAVLSDGDVDNVEAITPCPFPLLNQAAIRAVRDTWRFTAGPPRLFEVSIRFQLRRNN